MVGGVESMVAGGGLKQTPETSLTQYVAPLSSSHLTPTLSLSSSGAGLCFSSSGF